MAKKILFMAGAVFLAGEKVELRTIEEEDYERLFTGRSC